MVSICGFQKTTLLDYPGKVAATVFLSGCNYRCLFCHNTGLINGSAEPIMTEDELLAFLKRRKGVLEGVCITGGEPTLQPAGLEDLMVKIKDLGYQIKLDTNGSRPEVLKDLCGKGLVDYVAMDIKSGRQKQNYYRTCGMHVMSVAAVEESVEFLKKGNVPYEFRTTVVKGIHTDDDFRDIAKWIKGCDRYFLQGFVDPGNLPDRGLSAFTREEMEHFLKIVQPKVPQAQIRGVD